MFRILAGALALAFLFALFAFLMGIDLGEAIS
jgi:hypothetical protein